MDPDLTAKRIFITGIPASGKSYLANRLAEAVGGIVVSLDDLRESLREDEVYRKWIDFYLDKDEREYITETPPAEMWKDLVIQSEALWPAFLEEIEKYKDEIKPVIFESVNILPHLAHQDLSFPGVVLIGSSQDEILERNKKEPRWGETLGLQRLEAKMFFEVERPQYKAEAERYKFPVFEDLDKAFDQAMEWIG